MGDAGIASSCGVGIGGGPELGHARARRGAAAQRSPSGLCRRPSPLLCSSLGGDAEEPKAGSIAGGTSGEEGSVYGCGWMDKWMHGDMGGEGWWLEDGDEHSEWTNLVASW